MSRFLRYVMLLLAFLIPFQATAMAASHVCGPTPLTTHTTAAHEGHVPAAQDEPGGAAGPHLHGKAAALLPDHPPGESQCPACADCGTCAATMAPAFATTAVTFRDQYLSLQRIYRSFVPDLIQRPPLPQA